MMMLIPNRIKERIFLMRLNYDILNWLAITFHGCICKACILLYSQLLQVEALAVKLTQKEGELIQEKFEVKKLANFLKQVTDCCISVLLETKCTLILSASCWGFRRMNLHIFLSLCRIDTVDMIWKTMFCVTLRCWLSTKENVAALI